VDEGEPGRAAVKGSSESNESSESETLLSLAAASVSGLRGCRRTDDGFCGEGGPNPSFGGLVAWDPPTLVPTLSPAGFFFLPKIPLIALVPGFFLLKIPVILPLARCSKGTAFTTRFTGFATLVLFGQGEPWSRDDAVISACGTGTA